MAVQELVPAQELRNADRLLEQEVGKYKSRLFDAEDHLISLKGAIEALIVVTAANYDKEEDEPLAYLVHCLPRHVDELKDTLFPNGKL